MGYWMTPRSDKRPISNQTCFVHEFCCVRRCRHHSLKSDFGKFFLTLQKRVELTCGLYGWLMMVVRIYYKLKVGVPGNSRVNEKRMWWLGTTPPLLHIVLTLVAQINHCPKDSIGYNIHLMSQSNWGGNGEYMEVVAWCWSGVKNVIILHHSQGSLRVLHSIVGAHYVF